MELTQPLLDRLACPVCRKHLVLVPDGIACEGCGRLFPIVDGLPVLIAGRASQQKSSHPSQTKLD